MTDTKNPHRRLWDAARQLSAASLPTTGAVVDEVRPIGVDGESVIRAFAEKRGLVKQLARGEAGECARQFAEELAELKRLGLSFVVVLEGHRPPLFREDHVVQDAEWLTEVARQVVLSSGGGEDGCSNIKCPPIRPFNQVFATELRLQDIEVFHAPYTALAQVTYLRRFGQICAVWTASHLVFVHGVDLILRSIVKDPESDRIAIDLIGGPPLWLRVLTPSVAQRLESTAVALCMAGFGPRRPRRHDEGGTAAGPSINLGRALQWVVRGHVTASLDSLLAEAPHEVEYLRDATNARELEMQVRGVVYQVAFDPQNHAMRRLCRPPPAQRASATPEDVCGAFPPITNGYEAHEHYEHGTWPDPHPPTEATQRLDEALRCPGGIVEALEKNLLPLGSPTPTPQPLLDPKLSTRGWGPEPLGAEWGKQSLETLANLRFQT